MRIRFVVVNFCLSLKLFALNDFEVINVNQAHKDNYTGKGVYVGIVDSPLRENHSSLEGQIVNQALANSYTPDFTVDTHGSHVGGIIAGKFINSNSPYGVAYESKLYALQAFGHNASKINPQNVYDFFKDKEVKIINNSWGASVYPIVGMSEPGFYRESLLNQTPNYLLNLALQDSKTSQLNRLAQEKQVLLVFASGNEGILSPGLNATLPYYDESLRSYLVVGALDSSKISKNEKGQLVLQSQALSYFGNAFIGTQNFSLLAPGSNINSINSAYGIKPVFGNPDKNLYIKMSGTSMAAPMVSGAAALVAQKFPFLNGKQIADVLLSTANKDYQAPKLTVKQTKLFDVDKKKEKIYYTIIYIDTPVPKDIAVVKQDLQNIGYWSFEANDIVDNLISTYPLMQSAGQTYPAIQSLSKESMFGQGILDVVKALDGLAILDANRLNLDDVQILKDNVKEAYYTLDTGEFNAVFSNDISQRKWDVLNHNVNAVNSPQNQIDNLNVGFVKKGDGILTFEGDNSYLGFTIVKEGELKLLKRKNQSGGTITSKVFVEKDATFSGNGVVKNDLENDGVVRPGNYDLNDLSVEGQYIQKSNGSLILDFGKTQDGIDNSELLAKSYDIKGGSLLYAPLQGEFYVGGQSISIQLQEDLKEQLKNFSRVDILVDSSQSLDFKLDINKVDINKPEIPEKPETPEIPSEIPEKPETPSETPEIPGNDIIITPVLKPDAYDGGNKSMGRVLRSIRQRENLPQVYKDYFSFIDLSDERIYNSALSALEGKNSNIQELVNLQNTMIHDAIFSVFNPYYSDYASVFNSLLLASNSYSQEYFKLFDINDKKYFWNIVPNYERIRASEYDAYLSAINVNFGIYNSDLSVSSFGLNFFRTRFDFDFVKIKQEGLGVVYTHRNNFNIVDLLFGGSFSYGINNAQRNLLALNQDINSKYDNYVLGLQVGLTKDLYWDKFIISPLIYFNYQYVYQDAYSENQALFSKRYDAINYNTLAVAYGANFTYELIESDVFWNTFLLNEQKLNRKEIHHQVQFLDFSEEYFQERYKIHSSSFSFGTSLQKKIQDKYFLKLGLRNKWFNKGNDLSLFIGLSGIF